MATPEQDPAADPVADSASPDAAGRIITGDRAPGEVSDEPTPTPDASVEADPVPVLQDRRRSR